MTYKVTILRRAQKELEALAGEAYTRIRDAIGGLAEDPRPSGCLKLTGRDGWRIRIGNYRVIYEIRDKVLVVLVIRIAHRSKAYKK